MQNIKILYKFNIIPILVFFSLILVFFISGESASAYTSRTYESTFTSQIKDAHYPADFGDIFWTDDFDPATTSIAIYFRAGNTSSNPDGWTNQWEEYNNGDSIALSFDGNRYFQYQVVLGTDDLAYTPTLYDISVEIDTGNSALISSPYNTQDVVNFFQSISWSESTPGASDVLFQIRTSSDGATWTDWCGPDNAGAGCDTESWFTDPNGGELVDAMFNDQSSDQYIQYKMILVSDGINVPTVEDVNLQYWLDTNYTRQYASTFTSQVKDVGESAPYAIVNWNDDIPAGTSLALKMKTGTSTDALNAIDFTICDHLVNGQDPTSNNCVTDGDQYFQYQATLSTDDLAKTSTLYDISFTLEVEDGLISSPYDTNDTANIVGGVSWIEDENLPSYTSVRLYLRTGSTTDELASSTWVQVASSTSAGYLTDGCSKATSSQEVVCDVSVIPPSMKDGVDDRYFQYKIELNSYGPVSPVVEGVTIIYVVNARPDVFVSSAEQGADGIVDIEYIIRDIDTLTGSNPSNPRVLIKFEYFDPGDSLWHDCDATTGEGYQSVSDVQNVDGETDTYTTYSGSWTPSADFDEEYHDGTFKIRVVANDGEAANYEGSDESDLFILDTKDPVISDVDIIATTTPATVVINANDDMGMYMKVSTTSDFTSTPNWAVFATSSVILLPTDPDVVYVQLKDERGNISNPTSMSEETAETPTAMMIQDTSNVKTTPDTVYRLFIAWGESTDIDFSSYQLFKSLDNSNYSLLANITSSSTNYYADSAVAGDVAYYYKVSVVDTDDNASFFTDFIDAKANGVQDLGEGGGGTENTAPIITNVATSSVYTTNATITWDTNELSNSTIGYSTTTGVFTTEVGTDTLYDNSGTDFGAHRVELTGLEPNTTYYFKVKSTDINGNTSSSTLDVSGFTFTTLNGPEIRHVVASEVDNTSATISWNTYDESNNPAQSDSYVYYSTNLDMTGSLQFGSTELVSSHSVNLTSLTRGAIYYYYVTSGVAQDGVPGNYHTFETTYDASPPVISDLDEMLITDTSAIITWDTNELSDTKVYYGLTSGSYTASTSASSYSYDHTVNLTGLSKNTKYYYYVVSTDQSGNSASSSERSFTTLEELTEESEVVVREEAARLEGISQAPSSGGGSSIIIDKTDKIAPTISDIKITEITANTAKISWGTDELSNSFVEYGESKSYGDIHGNNIEDVFYHEVELKRLDPDTTYNFRVLSNDSWANLAMSDNMSFKTLTVIEDLIQDSTEELSYEDVQNLTDEETLALAAKKMTDMLSEMSNTVSLGELEDTLSYSYGSMEELSKLIPGPILAGEPKVVTTANTATIAWSTNKKSNSLVALANREYYDSHSADENPYAQTVGKVDDNLLNHVVAIYDLKPATTYHYQVRSKAIIGPEVRSRDFTFETKNESLDITNYTVDVISGEKAIFRWVTNVPADSEVRFAPYRNNQLSVDEADRKKDDSVSIIHEMNVEGFEAGVAYAVDMLSEDIEKNIASRKIEVFTTSEDDLPPVIYQVQTKSALSPGKDIMVQTIITWFTNEPSTTRLYYAKGPAGTTDKLTEETKLDTNYTKKHVVVITNFEPGTVYRFRAESIDSGGNISISKPYTILTPKQTESVFQVIMKNFEQLFGWVSKIKKE